VSERIVTVASTTDIVLATMWRELINAEGIPGELGGSYIATSVFGSMMPQMGTIDLFVSETDAVRARELIDEAEATDADHPRPPVQGITP
jgi:hypothetical protein